MFKWETTSIPLTSLLLPALLFTPKSAKSKINNFPKINSFTAQLLSNKWSTLRGLSVEVKVRKLGITPGLIVGAKRVQLLILH